MELIQQFGIQPVLLAAQVVNFLIILFLLKKLLYKPVLKMLKDRKEAIAEGIEKAEQARLLLEKAQKEEKEILQKAFARSEKIQEQAKSQASEILNNARGEAKQESEKMIADAKETIAKEADTAENKIIKDVTEISVKLLRKALSETVGAKTQKEIIAQTMGKLKKS